MIQGHCLGIANDKSILSIVENGKKSIGKESSWIEFRVEYEEIVECVIVDIDECDGLNVSLYPNLFLVEGDLIAVTV